MKIRKIAHFADIHIRKSRQRDDEIIGVLSTAIKKLNHDKPDLIVIVGDLVHDYLDLEPEQSIIATWFLRSLSKIAPVRITAGNHDMRKKNIGRIDSVEAMVKNMANPAVVYFKETGFYNDNNITWAVWRHGVPKNNPWLLKNKPEIPVGNVTIDLFHDPVNGCKMANGLEKTSNAYYKISDFKGEYSFFGDIHKQQYFSNKTKGYCGSLFANDFSEGDDQFHGYLLWDIENKTVKEVVVENEYSFKTVTVNTFTNYDNLNLIIPNPTKYMKIRISWEILPGQYTRENVRKVKDYLNEKYKPILITESKKFIEENKVEIREELKIDTITTKEQQHKIFTEYLSKIGVKLDIIEGVLKLDDEISSRLSVEDMTNIVWDIVRFGGKNFMSYENIEVDWSGKNGIFQISGVNTAGKTTIFKLITYILYNLTLETEKRVKFGDVRYVNNVLDVNYCEGWIILNVNNEFYGIKRQTEIKKNKAGEITGSPTTVTYHKLASGSDSINDKNSISNLNEDERKKTQKTIDKIIGTYDNFMRVVMTTSDTLNRILSSDPAEFIDSLLYDSGLDIFDRKLTEYKEYEKDVLKKNRITCDVSKTEIKIKELQELNASLSQNIALIENDKLVNLRGEISSAKKNIDELTRKIKNIDQEIYRLNVSDVESAIKQHEQNIANYLDEQERHKSSLNGLVEKYDADRLNNLIVEKDSLRSDESKRKMSIKDIEKLIANEEYSINLLNGDIKNIEIRGREMRVEVENLRKSKNCPTCGRLMDDEHIKHLISVINAKIAEMKSLADKIKQINDVSKPVHVNLIEKYKNDITIIEKQITDDTLRFNLVLDEIGRLTNEKQDVEKRLTILSKLETFPALIEVENLRIDQLRTKLKLRETEIVNIEENQKLENKILILKNLLGELENSERKYHNELTLANSDINNNKNNISLLTENIKLFQEQVKQDEIRNLYKQCVHRDGIPTQMLTTFIIPNINKNIENLLENVGFNVWLDVDELRPKFAYGNRPNSIIDAISSSGKERTFASLSLKVANILINAKSKPQIFLLDEVMGKLTEDSVEEFIIMLESFKMYIDKILIVEHNHEVNPDHILFVTKNENGVSELKID